jgi:hypothetical protein
MDGGAQKLHAALKSRFPLAAIHLLESAPRESFTDAHEDLPYVPKYLPGRFLLCPRDGTHLTAQAGLQTTGRQE